MDDCLFCKILKGEIPSEKIYEDDKVYAFKDIAPMAKYHFLFIPKEHGQNINDVSDFNTIFEAIKKVVAEYNFTDDGYRVVTNVNKFGGQTVFHTHFHLLAGEQLTGFGR
ncbi:histidine triad nucleotide-binding protein [Bacteriovoracaceae bacterium]|nr:histidine triad nucleotide-binding protein [Bacteriovoracaceae bacterium]